MTIEQRPACCWHVTSPGTGECAGGRHYPDEASARRTAGRIWTERVTAGFGEPDVHARQFPQPCWTARCDGPCGALLDEGCPVHAGSRAAMERECDASGWTLVMRGGRAGDAYCPADAPRGDDLADMEWP